MMYEMGHAMRLKIMTHAYHQISEYLQKPHQANSQIAKIFEKSPSEITRETIRNELLDNLAIFPLTHTYIGYSDGRFIGVTGDQDAQKVFDIDENDKATACLLALQKMKCQEAKPFDVKKRPWFQRALEVRSPAWTSPFLGKESQDFSTTAVLPIFNKQGEIDAVVGSSIELSVMNDFLENLYMRSNDDVFLIAPKQEIVIGSSSSNADFQKAILQKVKNSSELMFSASSDMKWNGERYFLNVKQLANSYGLDWSIVVTTSENGLLASAKEKLHILLMSGLIVLLITIMVTIFVARSIVRPITAMNHATQLLAKGNVGILPRSYIEEIYELSQSFDTMQQTIIQREKDLEALNLAYYHFVPKKFIELIGKTDITSVRCGDNKSQRVTILFSDIRSFTTISENMSPQDNFRFVNAYFERMAPQVEKHGGIIDKYIGDAIMALFHQPEDAIEASIAMQEVLHQYNLTRQRPERPALKIGFGIHTGLSIIGTVGNQERMEATVIGDSVNLASRLEGITKKYGAGLVISSNTYYDLTKQDHLLIRFLDRIQVKGKNIPVSIFEVFNGDTEFVRLKKLLIRKDFEQGVALYYLRQFEKAELFFEKCLEEFADDLATQIYLQRCKSKGKDHSSAIWVS